MTEEAKMREIETVRQVGYLLTNAIRAAVRIEHARRIDCDPTEVEVWWNEKNGLLDAMGPDGQQQEYGYEVRHAYRENHFEPEVTPIPS